MAQVEIILYVVPGCPWCEKAEHALMQRQFIFTTIDVTSSWQALRALLRDAGTPVVPTVVAYGEVMVGFDPRRLEQVLAGVQARADEQEAEEIALEGELRDSDRALRRALGEDFDKTLPELEDLRSKPTEME
ncbi:MAG: glutaredoxin family protein [Bacteroidales bacterium]